MTARVLTVPHPPLLVPELAAGAADETAELRAAVLRGARELTAASPHWTVLAALERPDAIGRTGSFGPYGVALPVSLDAVSLDAVAPGAGRRDADEPGAHELELPLLIAAWLREQAGAESVRVHAVPRGARSAECTRTGRWLGRALAASGRRAVLVVGDGAATHTARAPGAFDARAADFDDEVRDALATVDLDALTLLDDRLADELRVAGREAWQAAAATVREWGGRWTGSVLHSSAPYGVAYHVALWERRG